MGDGESSLARAERLTILGEERTGEGEQLSEGFETGLQDKGG